MNILKDFLYIQRNDRQALLAILSILAIILLLIFFIGGTPSEEEKSKTDSINHTLSAQATPEKPVYYKEQGAIKEAFPFDPNTADSTTLKRLGLSSWQIKSILHYRAKGGVFSRPSDFARVYGMTKRQYEALASFIRIADEYRPASDFYGNEPYYQNRRKAELNGQKGNSAGSQTAEKVYNIPHKLKAGEKVNVNSADTTELMMIPGIGSYYAKSVIRYRDRLGGFVSTQQLQEIEDFPESALAYISIDEQHVNKLDLNHLTLNELKRHPYLNFYQAKAICDYRRMHGPLKSLEQLRSLKDFPSDEIERLKPYVSF